MADFFSCKSGKKMNKKSVDSFDMNVKEVEHRFLLRELPPNIGERSYSSVLSEHVYLPGNIIQERFSKRGYLKDPDANVGDTVYMRTVKIGHGLERYEFEEPIRKELFEEVNSMSSVKHISKVRHRVAWPLSGPIRKDAGASCLIVEVDSFNDRNLFLAEIEVPHVDSIIMTPSWLSPSCRTTRPVGRKLRTL